MKELPYFKCTVQEWQNGKISMMSFSCKGLFWDICNYYWAKDCKVTDKMLSEKFKTSSKTIQKLIKKEVFCVQNGIVSISFLNEQLSELQKEKSFFSEMGKLGQKIKKSKAPLKPPLSDSLSYKIKEDKIKEDKEKKVKKEKIPIDKNTLLLKRSDKFKSTLTPFVHRYGREMIMDFFGYWTEPNKSRTKMRFELEKTWDTGRRLATWDKRSSNFKNNGKSSNWIDEVNKCADKYGGQNGQ